MKDSKKSRKNIAEYATYEKSPNSFFSKKWKRNNTGLLNSYYSTYYEATSSG